MHRSTNRILTTHVGSLIRPEVIRQHLRAKQSGEGYDAAAHARDLKTAVAEVVRQQAEAGIDVVNCTRRTALEIFPRLALEDALVERQEAVA